MRFRYRLEGSDQDWMETGSVRTAGFTTLPPGKYRLLVSARDDGGPWNTQPAALSIEQLPYLHQTLLFKLLLAAGFAAFGALLYSRRVRALQDRYASIIAERKRIAREWHDTLLGGLSGVSWQLQATRLRMTEQPEQAPQALETAQKMVEHCQAEARRVIWDLRESAAEDEPLPDAVASFLSKQREGTAIHGTMETRGQYARLPYEIEHSALQVGPGGDRQRGPSCAAIAHFRDPGVHCGTAHASGYRRRPRIPPGQARGSEGPFRNRRHARAPAEFRRRVPH